MDFFEQQAKAHRKTKQLVIYFALAVVSMIIMAGVAASQLLRDAFGYPSDHRGRSR